MSEQSQDTNVAADELLQLRLKELVKRHGRVILWLTDITSTYNIRQVGEEADTEKFSFKTARENKPSELSILIKFTGLVHLDFRNAEAGSLDERKKGPIQFLDILFAQGRSSPIFDLSKSFKAVRIHFIAFTRCWCGHEIWH
ncbi:hypothetical protein TSPI_00984 [Trichinella spiralis]|uniref:Uncharacterized protein n=1 Tax=Trichinella spiralis TaxID=6334 RepID=A0ABR3KI19_TRISP